MNITKKIRGNFNMKDIILALDAFHNMIHKIPFVARILCNLISRKLYEASFIDDEYLKDRHEARREMVNLRPDLFPDEYLEKMKRKHGDNTLDYIKIFRKN